MKAKIVSQESNGKNHGDKRELVSAYSVIALIGCELREVVTARAYMGRSASASTVYASIWVSGKGVYTAGSGSAGGYGYHKESAAFAAAIRSAGIELDADIAGRGEGAMRDAFEAIARAIGARGKLITVSH